MTKPIDQFTGEHRFLSNFWPCKVLWNGRTYPSLENAYQAAKFPVTKRDKFVNCSPSEAKRFGREPLGIRKDWGDVKLLTMEKLISRKFLPGSFLSDQLMATAPRELIEGNWWGDTFWGVCQDVGHNHLGQILMARRMVLLGQA